MSAEVHCDGCGLFLPCKLADGYFWCVDCFPTAVPRRAP